MSYEFKERETENFDYECNHASSDFDINYASGGPISYRGQKSETKHNIAKPNTYQVWDDNTMKLNNNFEENSHWVRKIFEDTFRNIRFLLIVFVIWYFCWRFYELYLR